MYQKVLYTYLGTNGTLTTPIHLENIYSVKKIQIDAERGKILTDGNNQKYSVIVSEDEVGNWYEIDDDGQNQLI